MAGWRIAQFVLLPKKRESFAAQKLAWYLYFDACTKLMSSVLVRWLQIAMEHNGIDAQTGFRLDRGTIDRLVTTYVR